MLRPSFFILPFLGMSECSDEDAPCCRFCQSSEPIGPLIRPCKCSGSQAYVHVDCLNQWRATSKTARTKCPVCRFKYITKNKTYTALVSRSLISHPRLLGLASSLSAYIIIFILGAFLVCIPTGMHSSGGFTYDVPELFAILYDFPRFPSCDIPKDIILEISSTIVYLEYCLFVTICDYRTLAKIVGVGSAAVISLTTLLVSLPKLLQGPWADILHAITIPVPMILIFHLFRMNATENVTWKQYFNYASWMDSPWEHVLLYCRAIMYILLALLTIRWYSCVFCVIRCVLCFPGMAVFVSLIYDAIEDKARRHSIVMEEFVEQHPQHSTDKVDS